LCFLRVTERRPRSKTGHELLVQMLDLLNVDDPLGLRPGLQLVPTVAKRLKTARVPVFVEARQRKDGFLVAFNKQYASVFDSLLQMRREHGTPPLVKLTSSLIKPPCENTARWLG